jgi:hypothetical protein
LTSGRGGALGGIRVGGGASVPISGVGLCGNFQVQSAIGCGKLLPAPAIVGPAAPSSATSSKQRGSALLDSGKRWFGGWRLLIVKPETVLSWQRLGWRAYWTWRSSRRARGGRPAIAGELQALIRRMSTENSLWGQKRIQAELARLGFKVSARTVAKYMRARDNRAPSPGWREFLKRHAPDIWACDFFCVRTVLFQTLHVFFVVRHAKRETLHAEVTRHPTADWATQQIVEYCAWDRARPRFSIHDRDSRYGASFDRRAASSHAFQITSTQRSR